MSSKFANVLSRNVSRRDLLYKSLIASCGAAFASGIGLPFSAKAASKLLQSPPTPNSLNDIKTIYSACMVNCGSRCPLKVLVKDGIAIKVTHEDGINDAIYGQHQIRPCLRGRSTRWRTYSPDRLKYPMLRIGKRGEGKFKRISWDEATTLVAEKLKYTIHQYGNETIYYQYGSGGSGHNLQGSNAGKRLLSLMGGFLDMHGTYSTGQITAIEPYIYGDSNRGSFLSEIAYSDLVVLFGHNVAETRMSGGGQISEMYNALAQSHAKVIIIDPRRTDSVTGFHADWMPIRPGTDGALVAALVYTMITENLTDEETINRYVTGWDDAHLPASAPEHASYKSYILGLSRDNTAKTPVWASQITGIPAQRIVQLAREICAAKACFIAAGWGLQRTQNGEQACRAIMALPIVANQWGRRGTNNGTWGNSVSYPVPSFAIPNPIKTSISHFMWTDAIVRGTEMTAKADGVQGADKLATNIKFLWHYASNVTGNQHADLNKTAKILEDESLCEFIVMWENHLTPSTKFADLLLPDVTYIESDDLINNSYATGPYSYVIRVQHAIDPLWEARPSYDVFAEIAGKLGIKAKYTEGKTQQQWIEECYNKMRHKNPALPTFEQTDGMGVIDRQLTTGEQHIALKAFRDDPVTNKLTTPSGKIEFYSEALANLAKTWELKAGDIISPIPDYCPAIEGFEDIKPDSRYPLQMSGYHTKGHAHSTYSNVPQLKEAAPDLAWINPLTAQRYGIENGDIIEIFNDRGRIHIKAKVTNKVIPNVVTVPEGGWATYNNDGVDIGGCINTLTSMRPSPLAKSNGQHTNLVDIKKV